MQREDLAAAFKRRGNAYDDVGDYDNAVDDYRHAIAINPRNAGVFNDRGTSYRAMGKTSFPSSIMTRLWCSIRKVPWRSATAASPRQRGN